MLGRMLGRMLERKADTGKSEKYCSLFTPVSDFTFCLNIQASL